MVKWEERRPECIFVSRYNEVGKQVSPREHRFLRREVKDEERLREESRGWNQLTLDYLSNKNGNQPRPIFKLRFSYLINPGISHCLLE
jgi:hypothetical protein